MEDELRGFVRPDEARHVGDDIDTSVVDALVESVTKRSDILHRFYALKARLLGLPKLAYHERNIEYGSLEKKYSYEEAVALVKATFAKLDPEFASIVQSFVDEGRIDAFPKNGKSGGAFNVDNLKTLPVFILLNHVDTISSVTTLAHEL